MTESKRIIEKSKSFDFTDCLNDAENNCIESESDYEKEETIFSFKDESGLIFSAVDYSIKEI